MAELSPVNVQQLLIPFYHSWQHWWFGARWFGFLGSPCERDCYLGVSLESQTTGSQTTNSPWVELLFFRWIMNNLDSRVWDIRIVNLNIHLAPYNSLGTPKKPRTETLPSKQLQWDHLCSVPNPYAITLCRLVYRDYLQRLIIIPI